MADASPSVHNNDPSAQQTDDAMFDSVGLGDLPHLSDELWLHIFDFVLAPTADELKYHVREVAQTRLVSYSTVCKEWYRLLSDYKYWRTVDLSPLGSNATDASLGRVVSKAPLLRSINLSGCNQLSSAALRSLVEVTPGVEEVNISAVHRTGGSVLAAIAESWQFLQSVTMTSLFVTNEDLAALLTPRICGQLVHLDIARCFSLTDDILPTLASLSAVESLSLQGCWKLSDQGVAQVLIANLPALTHFVAPASAEALTCLALAEHQTKLKILDLSWCTSLTNEMLVGLAPSLASVEEIYLADIDELKDDPVLAIADSCERLRVVCLDGCRRLRNDAITYLVERHGATLESLMIKGGYKYRECIVDVGRNCPNLTCLDVSDCGEVRNEAIIQIADGCPKLQRLALGQVMKLSTDGFEALPRLQNLEFLDLINCVNLQNYQIAAIGEGCPNLVSLMIGRVDGERLGLIAEYFPNLVHLRIFRGWFDDDELEIFSVGAPPHLRILQLLRCRNVTEAGVEAAKESIEIVSTVGLRIYYAVVEELLGHRPIPLQSMGQGVF